nr:unnamed protein product [Callosobruchus chinensis]
MNFIQSLVLSIKVTNKLNQAIYMQLSNAKIVDIQSATKVPEKQVEAPKPQAKTAAPAKADAPAASPTKPPAATPAKPQAAAVTPAKPQAAATPAKPQAAAATPAKPQAAATPAKPQAVATPAKPQAAATPAKPQAAATPAKTPAAPATAAKAPVPSQANAPAASPTKPPAASPTKPQATSPAKPPAASPTKSPAVSPTKASAESPAKPQAASPTKSPAASPAKAQSASPAKPAAPSPTKVPAAGDGSAPAKDDKAKAATLAQSAKSSEERSENGEIDQQEKMEAEDIPSEESQEKPKADADSKGSSDRSKGEKRKRSSPSPERQERKRQAPEIREDEPTIDKDKVLLSWYDSDLNLQIDKEAFLSARPLTEGAFGYAWAGVRATHGVTAGKVCYEVKITEKLKWDDFGNYQPRTAERDRYRTDHRKRERSREGRSKDGKDKDSRKKDNGDKEESKNSKDGDVEMKEDESSEKTGESKETEKKEESKEADKSETMEVEESKEAEKQEDSKDKDEGEGKKDESKQKDEDSTEKSEDSKDEKKDKEPQREPLPTHFFRLGWSMPKCGLQLGEEKHSFGFESTGKFVTDCQFTDFASSYKEGDVIGAFLSIVGGEIVMRFTINGTLQEAEYKANKSDFPVEGFALFPHVLSRNFAFEINLGDKEAWFPVPDELEGYQFISKLEDKISGPARPENRSDCEVIMMCGLPASGKTHWVKEHLESNADKSYTVISTSNLLERMKVAGVELKSEYRGKWPYLLDKLQKAMSRLHWMASQRRRNYILDQTNVYPSAQRRKLQPFEGFKRKAVIIVLGDEEQARRQALKKAAVGSKEVPDSTVLEMKVIQFISR